MLDISQEILRRVNLKCDRISTQGEIIYFYFDTEELWSSVFLAGDGVKDAVARAYMIGFRQYIFVRHDGREYHSDNKYWFPRERGHRRGRFRGRCA
jgi:hypothetical protein